MAQEMEQWQLKQKQSLPLKAKIRLSEVRIKQWYDYWCGQVYVAFSGGKDSTVLLHIVRSLYPKTKAVFFDTGLEYPETRQFVKTVDNVEWLKPKMSFREVIGKYGYPVISKEQARYINDCQNATENNKITVRRRLTGINRNGIQTKKSMISKKWIRLVNAPFKISGKCCDIMKKYPALSYQRKTKTYPYVGTMASDSSMRQRVYLKTGCNAYNTKQSKPLSVWLEKDIWDYINKYKVRYNSIYDTGVQNTGCVFCMFGVHLEKKPNRFQLLNKTHPKLYDYCINKLGCGNVLDYIGVEYENNGLFD